MPPHPRDANREALIHAEIERSLAKWKGMVPAPMVAKMREMAEEYYRTDPIAVRVVNLMVEESTREESGHEPALSDQGIVSSRKGGGRR